MDQEEQEPPVSSQAEEEQGASVQDPTTVEGEQAEEAVHEETAPVLHSEEVAHDQHTEELVVPDQVSDQVDEIAAHDEASIEDEAQQNEEQVRENIFLLIRSFNSININQWTFYLLVKHL